MSATISDDLEAPLGDSDGIVWRHGRGGVRVTLREPPRDRFERVEALARAAAAHWSHDQVRLVEREQYVVRLRDGWAGRVGVTTTRELAKIKSCKRVPISLSMREAEQLERELDEVRDHRAAG